MTTPSKKSIMPSGSISKLNIKINVSGEVEFVIQDFNPKMINKYSQNDFIYFIPTIPVTIDTLIASDLINNKSPNSSDFIDVFTSPQDLNKIVNSIKMNRKFKPITIDEAERKGFITTNIETILFIFFNENNNLTYDGGKYPIHSYDWNGMYKLIKTTGKFPDFSIEIDLNVLDSNKSGTAQEKQSLSCDIRKRRILKTMGFTPKPIKSPRDARKTRKSYNNMPTTYKTNKMGGRKKLKNTRRKLSNRRFKNKKHYR